MYKYVYRNIKLEEAFPFLIRKSEELHINDPERAWFLASAQDLLFLAKRDTLAFIKSIDDPSLLSNVMTSNCWVHFPQKSFVDELKKAIEKFKDTKWYDHLNMWHQEAEKYLVDEARSKIENRKYRESLKKG
jgi:hypothetical protein